MLVVPVYDPDLRAPFQELPEVEMPAKTLGRKLPGPIRGRKLLADERCSQAVLDFLATTDVKRAAGSPVAEGAEGAASEVSEWEDREHEERLALLREQGAG